MLLVAFVMVFFLPEEKLRTMSGIQARQQQEADEAAVAAEAAGVSASSSQMVDGALVEESAVAAASAAEYADPDEPLDVVAPRHPDERPVHR